MPTPQHIHTEALALAFEEGGRAPEWVQLTPAGPNLLARDGRSFTIDTAEVIEAFRARRIDLVMDYEHGAKVRAEQGLPSPAAGWITDLEDRDGALWGRVRWTDAGGAHVLAREYRFVSPALMHSAGRVVRLHSAGLTNTPAFEMAELAAAQEETTPMPDAIREKLGLEDGASEADVLAAIGALEEKGAATATASEKEVDPALYVPRSDFEAATARLSELEKGEKARGEAAITGAVDAAIAAGKVTPAARDIQLAACRAMGVEAFSEAMDKQPVIAGSTLAGRKPTEAEGAAGLTADEIAVARELGQTPEQFAEGKKKDAA